VNGRLRFDKLQDLHDFMTYAKNTDDLTYEKKMKEFEAQGFVPLQYDRSEHDEELMLQVQARKLVELDAYNNANPASRIQSYEIDDEDELIADPYYASILNQGREVQVSENIYKYTPDGLYSTGADNEQALNDYLENGDGTLKTIEACIIDYPRTEGVYLIEYPIDGCGGGGSGGGGSTVPEPNLDDFGLCTDNKGGLWQDIFGPKVECIDKWDDRRRVKTKVWNQNYFLYSSIGISVRAQKRSLRV
jgi:hypothetical protein